MKTLNYEKFQAKYTELWVPLGAFIPKKYWYPLFTHLVSLEDFLIVNMLISYIISCSN